MLLPFFFTQEDYLLIDHSPTLLSVTHEQPSHPACPPALLPPHPASPPRSGARACVQNESALFVVLFRARAVSSSPLEMLRTESTLIISDPRERRALSLHTIKAEELPRRTYFSMNSGSQSTHTKKSSPLSPSSPLSVGSCQHSRFWSSLGVMAVVWQVSEAAGAGINSPICIMHHRQIQLSGSTKEWLFQ